MTKHDEEIVTGSQDRKLPGNWLEFWTNKDSAFLQCDFTHCRHFVHEKLHFLIFPQSNRMILGNSYLLTLSNVVLSGS